MLQSLSPTRPTSPRCTIAATIVFAIVALAITAGNAAPARALNCVDLLPFFQQGGSDAQIAEVIGAPQNTIASCRSELSRPLVVGPDGVPPVGAAGAPPVGAPGRPPSRAVGPPPVGAVGPPPIGHTIKRLP